MGKELLFGAAYYPEYMPCDRIEKDLEMMKAAGMNVIRIAESTWSTLEPVDGRFDFSYIDRTLEAAGQKGMQVIIGTPTYAIPSWLEKKDPGVMVVTKDGRTRYGHRQLIDLQNSTFRFHAERVIRELISHTAKHPAVIGFQIDNETKHYDNMGEEVQRLFRAYLKEKFVTTENLNKTFYLSYWSNSIHEWEDFPDMRGCIHAGLMGEFDQFRRQLAADYLAWQADLVGVYKREEQFITHNLDFEWKKLGAEIAQDGYSYGVQPDMNHLAAAKCLTIAGADIYHPTQDDLTGAEIAFGADAIRCLKEAGYLVTECQAQAFKYWTPYPGQLRLQAYSHLAGGALGIMYWNWHSIHNGYETYWRGVLSHDLLANPVYEEAGRIGEEWQKLGERLKLQRKDNAVALVVDHISLSALRWFPIDRELSYNDVVRWMYDSLYERNIECDVVDVHALDTEKYRMIVTPALYCASEETLEKLEKFVERGGVLVSSFRSFVANEYCSVYPDMQPHRLYKCFGMSYNQFTNPGRTKIKGRPTAYFAELLKPEGAESLADYEHRYWGKYAGITSHSYGKGKAYYVGCYTEKEVLKEIYELAAEAAGLSCTPKEQCWPLIIRSGVNAQGKKLHYILHYREEEQEFICPYECVENLLDGTVYHKGDAIAMCDWDIAVLEERTEYETEADI